MADKSEMALSVAFVGVISASRVASMLQEAALSNLCFVFEK